MPGRMLPAVFACLLLALLACPAGAAPLLRPAGDASGLSPARDAGAALFSGTGQGVPQSAWARLVLSGDPFGPGDFSGGINGPKTTPAAAGISSCSTGKCLPVTSGRAPRYSVRFPVGWEVTVRSAEDLTWILENGTYAIISAGANPGGSDATAIDPFTLLQRHARLRAGLRLRGFAFIEVLGRYGSTEPSFLVLADGSGYREVLALGRQYGQESVIIGGKGEQALVYTSDTAPAGGTAVARGSWYGGRGFVAVPSEEPDFFTEVPVGDGDVPYRFVLDFDTATLHLPPEGWS